MCALLFGFFLIIQALSVFKQKHSFYSFKRRVSTGDTHKTEAEAAGAWSETGEKKRDGEMEKKKVG